MASDASDVENALPSRSHSHQDHDHDDKAAEGTAVSSTVDATHAATTTEQERYSVWSFREKLCIIALTGAASMLSSMSANVYFPAIPSIASDLGVSIAKVNLTITSYLVLQGLSPMFFGPLADYKGRRLAYVSCLIISAGACTGMALLPNRAYWLLVLLRCLQSAGSASTISIGYGSIMDIATPGERGTFIGLLSLGPMAGPSIGPIIAGALADKFGWRGIFKFMAAFNGVVCLAIILFLPETLRAVVHAGEVRPIWYLRPVIPVLTHYETSANVDAPQMPQPKRQSPWFLKEWIFLVILTSNACCFGLFQALMSSLSSIFEDAYPFLTQTTIGLCFLSVGSGALIGSIVTGRITDAEFRRAGGTKGIGIPDGFPVERARLRLLPIYVGTAAVTAIAAGWAVDTRASIAIPLVFHFFFGWTAIASMNAHQVLLMDLAPGQGASVTAANNLFRCLLSAGLVAALDPLRKAIGVGGLFVLLAGAMVVLVAPLVVIVRVRGPRWRERRAAHLTTEKS